jgi:hypothetical protein
MHNEEAIPPSNILQVPDITSVATFTSDTVSVPFPFIESITVPV